MKTLTLFSVLFLFTFLITNGQGPANAFFIERESVPCPFDNSVTIEKYEDWIIYQTLGGAWDDPIDSSICTDIKQITSSWRWEIDLETIDPTRPIFIRSTASIGQLSSNVLYGAIADFIPSEGITLNHADTCANGVCTGLIVQIEIPDSTGNGFAIREYKAVDPYVGYSGYLETCIPTEYFDYNVLKEFIIKIQLEEFSLPPNAYISPFSGYLENVWNPALIDFLTIPEWSFQDTSYDVALENTVEETSWSYNYVLRYGDESSYPNSSNLYYVEAIPEVNATTPQTFNVSIGDYIAFTPQPFTAIRGGLVQGSDSLRHHVNLINNGGDFCLTTIIDLVIDNDVQYLHNAGNLYFAGKQSCMMFRKGSVLGIGDGATLHYGHNGQGILAMQHGSTIKFGENSRMVIDNMLWLQGLDEDGHINDITVELKPGNELIFGEFGNIFSTPYSNGHAKLRVLMNGGVLDDSKLSAEKLALIERIYPEPTAEFAKNLDLYPNPSYGEVTLKYIAAAAGEITARLLDLNGKLIQQFPLTVERGYNELPVNLPPISAGIYFFEVAQGQRVTTFKLIKM